VPGSTRTSVGLQWFKDTQYQTDARGYSLPPGAQTPNGAQLQLSSETTNENATYGAFLEEVLGWSEKRFLTLGVRTDQNSAFGSNAGNAVYPRAAISWSLLDEDWFPKFDWMSDLRLRGAYGQAGQFPTVTTAPLQFLSAFSVPIGGAETAALRLQSQGNADLKPEVTAEIELGADVAFWNNRLGIELTYFNKESRDALCRVVRVEGHPDGEPLDEHHRLGVGVQPAVQGHLGHRHLERALVGELRDEAPALLGAGGSGPGDGAQPREGPAVGAGR